MMPTIAEFYAQGRARLLSLAVQLGADAAATPVPALPGWTVKDTYAHLAGTCADYIDGRLGGRGTPDWTARQVEERRGADLPEVCAEWQRRGPELDGLIQQVEDDAGDEVAAQRRFFHLIPELWAHEYDIRGALVWLAPSQDEATSYVISRLVDHFQDRWRTEHLPALRIVGDEGDWWLLGEGEPVATLTGTGDYELARMLIGRRSRDQILAMGWKGDPAAFVDHLHLFELPDHDVLD